MQGPYVLVLVAFQHGPHFRLLPGVWCVRAYQSLPRAFRKNVKHVLLLQPSLTVRAALALLYPFVSSKAHAKVKQVREQQCIVLYGSRQLYQFVLCKFSTAAAYWAWCAATAAVASGRVPKLCNVYNTYTFTLLCCRYGASCSISLNCLLRCAALQVHRLLDIEAATAGEVQVSHLGEQFLTALQQLSRARSAPPAAAHGSPPAGSRTVPVPGAVRP